MLGQHDLLIAEAIQANYPQALAEVGLTVVGDGTSRRRDSERRSQHEPPGLRLARRHITILPCSLALRLVETQRSRQVFGCRLEVGVKRVGAARIVSVVERAVGVIRSVAPTHRIRRQTVELATRAAR